MLVPVSRLRSCTIAAVDGDIGAVKTVYFDDASWTVRYVVVDTGAWLPGRKVLVSPFAIRRVDVAAGRLVADLTRRQVEESPPIDEARPVSRQYEASYLAYYGYPHYWSGPERWGPALYPGAVLDAGAVAPPPEPPYPRAVAEELAAREREGGDPHLRSAEAVAGHGVEASDGGVGHVEDFLVDERTWAIRYLVVDPVDWWPGPHVIVSPEWVSAIDWNESKVHVDVTRDGVRNAPEYVPGRLDRAYEETLHAHHRRPGYWDRAA